jgi:diacylglycerol O-acyltransferase
VVSNVAGSPGEQCLAGGRLQTLYPVGSICHGMALFIAAYSGGDRFHIGFTADAASIPDLPRLAAHTDTVLVELEQALSLHG